MKALLLLLVAGAALAQDDPVRAALDAGRYEDALALAEAMPKSQLRDYERAQAICGIARNLRREKGYAAAIDFLEPRLDHPLVLKAYADCCVWGGQEERGLRGLGGAKGEGRAAAEMLVLKRGFRYEETAALARKEGWKEWERWASGEAELRERLLGRARRARWLAAAGVALLLSASFVVRRALRPSSARATA